MAPTAASAQGRAELLSTPPAGLKAGQTWTAELFVNASPQELAASSAPTILLHNEAAGWTKITVSPVPGEAVAAPDGDLALWLSWARWSDWPVWWR